MMAWPQLRANRGGEFEKVTAASFAGYLSAFLRLFSGESRLRHGLGWGGGENPRDMGWDQNEMDGGECIIQY